MNYCPTVGKNCMQMYSVEGQNHTNKTLTGAFEYPASSVEHWQRIAAGADDVFLP